MRIPTEIDQHLVRHGYAVVPDFLTPDELTAARRNMLRYFPTPEELAATPERYASILEDPEHLQIEFPFAGEALNDIATHPELIALVEPCSARARCSCRSPRSGPSTPAPATSSRRCTWTTRGTRWSSRATTARSAR